MKLKNFGLICLATVGMVLPALAQENMRPAESVLVCRARQCAAASYSMTRGFLFNKIAQMVEANIGKTALLCEADPVSHVCLTQGIQATANAAFAKTEVVIPSVRIVDTKLAKGGPAINIVLDYDIQANKTTPRCQLAMSHLSVDYVDKVEMTTDDFACNLTETGNTSFNLSYNIDYLDFDYGFIGGWYTLGIGEAVRGDKTGYVLMRLTNKADSNVEVVDPELVAMVQASAESITPTPVVEPEILKETAPTAETKAVEKTNIVVATPARPRTIKTVVTETTTIIPGPNGGHVTLPKVRTMGVPEDAVIVEKVVINK